MYNLQSVKEGAWLPTAPVKVTSPYKHAKIYSDNKQLTTETVKINTDIQIKNMYWHIH